MSIPETPLEAVMSGVRIKGLDPKSLSAHLSTRGVSPGGTQSVRGMEINAFKSISLTHTNLLYL